MGSRSSAARLSATVIMTGRPAALCSRTNISALAVGVSPETRNRPVPSFRWEAARRYWGNFSTSAKRSRTNGRTIAFLFYQQPGVGYRIGRVLLAAEWPKNVAHDQESFRIAGYPSRK